MQSAYLDYAASAPLDPRVAEAMKNAAEMPGNPSSIHGFGRAVRATIDGSRKDVAALFGVAASAVTFTSGATEANGLALEGSWHAIRRANPDVPMRILVGPFEHASVWETVLRLAKDEGAAVDVLPAGKDGVVDAKDVASALTPQTVIVSVQWVNNVIGTIQPVAEIGKIVSAERARRAPSGLPLVFHSDAVQAVGTQEVFPIAAGVDLLTFSGHKICGPKGVGGVIRAPGIAIEPVAVGGGQEAGLRHGTENVAAIAGLGAAARALIEGRNAERQKFAGMRAVFVAALGETVPDAEVIGDPACVIPTTVFVRLPRRSGDLAMLSLDAAGIAVSAGSACDAGSRRASRTLLAVLDEQRAHHGGVRVSFGRFTSEQDLSSCIDALARVR